MARAGKSAGGVKVINPDFYLESDGRRIWTPERNKLAWDQCYQALEEECRQLALTGGMVLLVCGVQGSGKSAWIEKNAASYGPCVCFDAALPKVIHRRPIVDIAQRFGTLIKAVHIDVPLQLALSRNMLRRVDERVPEEAIRDVFRQFEAPTCEEGFAEVICVGGLA